MTEVCHVENARFLARTIPGARYVELAGDDHVPWFAPDDVIAEIREFLTGQREAATPDRVLATVPFTASSDRRSARPSLATEGGVTFSGSTMRWCAAS